MGDRAALLWASLLVSIGLAGCPAPPLDGVPDLADGGPTPVGALSGADLADYTGAWSVDLQQAGQVGLRYVGESACWRFDECASTRAALREGPAPNFDFDGNGLAERYVAPTLRDDGALPFPPYAAWRLATETTDRAPCRDCEGDLSTAEVIPFMPSGDPGFALPMRLLPHRDAPALHAIGPGIVDDWLSCFRWAGFSVERVGAGRNPTIELEVRPDMEWRFEDGGWAYDLITCQAKVFTRANTWRCPDEDEDDIDDLCDCEQVDPLPDDDAPLAERYCHDPDTAPEMGGRPGRWVCRPGEQEKTCEPYPSVNAWLEEAVLGDLPGSDAIYEASAIDYVHVDSLDELQDAQPRCPPGEICQAQAARAAKRGHQFEAHVCRRLLAKHRGDVECKQHPNPFMRRPKFRTEALQWALPPGLAHDRSKVVLQPAGRLRYPDYVTRGPNRVVLGEAKCYSQTVWSRRSAYFWFRGLAFGTQLEDYLNKVVAGRRGAGPRFSVIYNFCAGTPGWTALMIAAGLAKVQGDGFTLRLNDNDGRPFIMDPLCWEAGLPLTVAQTAFACYMPGEVAPEGVSPAWNCLGAFYDNCDGSE